MIVERQLPISMLMWAMITSIDAGRALERLRMMNNLPDRWHVPFYEYKGEIPSVDFSECKRKQDELISKVDKYKRMYSITLFFLLVVSFLLLFLLLELFVVERFGFLGKELGCQEKVVTWEL
jgi:hypothetical protein